MFKPCLHNGTWWLRLREPGPEITLVAVDYYLLHRVEALEHLSEILEEMDEALVGEEEGTDTPPERRCLHVWKRSFGPEDCTPLQ